MTPQPEIVRHSDLINQLVLDRQTLEELGRVDALWMYPPVHRVLGLICKSGFLGSKKAAFKLAQITAVGENGILTDSPPDPTDAERVKQLESLLQHEVWSDSGNKIGKVTDCLLNWQTGEITFYLFTSSGWMGVIGEVYQLPPAQILSFSKKRVLVAESAADQFSCYQAGIPQKLNQAKEALAERAETVTEQARERFQILAEQAKERAELLAQKAREKAQVLNEQIREETQGLTERARDRGQTIAGQVKERSHALSKQVEEGIQTLTVQAEEILDAVIDEPLKPKAPEPSKAPEPTAAPNPGKTPAAGSDLDEDIDLDDDEPWI